jgi:hypothetical protein
MWPSGGTPRLPDCPGRSRSSPKRFHSSTGRRRGRRLAPHLPKSGEAWSGKRPFASRGRRARRLTIWRIFRVEAISQFVHQLVLRRCPERRIGSVRGRKSALGNELRKRHRWREFTVVISLRSGEAARRIALVRGRQEWRGGAGRCGLRRRHRSRAASSTSGGQFTHGVGGLECLEDPINSYPAIGMIRDNIARDIGVAQPLAPIVEHFCDVLFGLAAATFDRPERFFKLSLIDFVANVKSQLKLRNATSQSDLRSARYALRVIFKPTSNFVVLHSFRSPFCRLLPLVLTRPMAKAASASAGHCHLVNRVRHS